MTFTRKQAVEQWDAKFSQLNASVQDYISECSDIPFPLLQNSHSGDGVTGAGAESDISMEEMLLHFSNQLDRLTGLEDKLKRTRMAMLSHRNMSVTLAPINRLPPDLLSYIIETGHIQGSQKQSEWKDQWEDDWGPDEMEPEEIAKDPKKDGVQFGVLFSWVCRKWRQAAISMGMLWSEIDFRGSPPFDREKEYIRRSKASPLTVYINGRVQGSPLCKPENLDQALQTISADVPRVKSLVVNLWSMPEILKVLKLFCQDSNQPHLELLRLYFISGSNGGQIDGEVATRLFYNKRLLERIRHLAFDNVYVVWNNVMFGNIRSLRLAKLEMYMLPSMHQLHTILAGSSGLESLALEELRFSIIGRENDSSKLPPIILPSLHTLKLDHINMEANSLILSTLIAPNLVRLSLGGMEGEGDTNLLSTFIKGLQQTIVLKSGSTVIESSLRCLRLAECRFQSATVEKMILSLTNLRDITFCLMGCVTDTLFSSLVIPDQEEMGSSHACKRLRVMRILYCYNLTRINVLKKVVTSRKGTHQGSDGQELDGLMVYKCPIEDEARSGEWFRQNVRNVHWSCNQSG